MWSRLRAIFPSKTISIDQSLPANFSRQVEQAIFLFTNHDNLNTDEEVVKLFIENGIGAREAKEILLFLPIAFIRQWLTTVKWLDTYLERVDEKRMVERKYGETKSYQIIWQVTTQYFMDNPQKDTVIKIGGRSAEFHVINQLLLDNPTYKPEDVQLTQTIINR